MRNRQLRRMRYSGPDWYEDPLYYYPYPPQQPYGALGFLGDVFMTILTGGFWLIRIYVREMRRRNVHHH